MSKIKFIVSELIHKLNYSSLKQGNGIEDDILYSLKKDGYYVYPNFISDEECNLLREKADVFIENNPDKVKHESNGCDIRVYGVDRYTNDFNIEKLESFSTRLFKRFSWARKPDHFMLLGKIIAGENNLGSGSGWHRDSPLRHQFKTIVYLSDVEESNGPFQYVKGSHAHNSISKVSKFLIKGLNERRFKEKEIVHAINENIIQKPTTFIAKAGTVLIFNTRGLHRGKTLENDKRYALTNYHFENGVNEKFFQTK